MLFRRKPYQLLIPPLSKPFPLMTQEEAEAFFQWFLSQLDGRVAYLSAHFPHPGVPPLSPRSLIPLWAWFLRQAKTEVTPDEVTERNRAKLWERSPELAKDIFRSGARRLTYETELLLLDIGMYLGQTFVQNEQGLRWTHYGPDFREDIFVNKPVVAGFQSTEVDPPFDMYFEPVHMASVQAVKLLSDKADSRDLYRLYQQYAETYIKKPDLD